MKKIAFICILFLIVISSHAQENYYNDTLRIQKIWLWIDLEKIGDEKFLEKYQDAFWKDILTNYCNNNLAIYKLDKDKNSDFQSPTNFLNVRNTKLDRFIITEIESLDGNDIYTDTAYQYGITTDSLSLENNKFKDIEGFYDFDSLYLSVLGTQYYLHDDWFRLRRYIKSFVLEIDIVYLYHASKVVNKLTALIPIIEEEKDNRTIFKPIFAIKGNDIIKTMRNLIIQDTERMIKINIGGELDKTIKSLDGYIWKLAGNEDPLIRETIRTDKFNLEFIKSQDIRKVLIQDRIDKLYNKYNFPLNKN